MAREIRRFISEHFAGRSVYGVQAGAGGGPDKDDPLADGLKSGRWQGILIEPIPYLFQKLCEAYAGIEGLVFDNVAVSNTRESHLVMYYLDENANDFRKLPEWAEKLGSFRLDHIASHPLASAVVKSVVVRCTTLSELLARHHVSQVDFLQCDTEGHDSQVLESLNWQQIQPEVVIIENKHMSGPFFRGPKYCRCLRRLEEYNYKVVYEDPP